jgi:phytoene desaturase
MHSQLEAIEPGSFRAYLNYLEEGYRHYHLAMRHLVERDFRSLAEFMSPQNIPLFLRIKSLSRHYRNVGRYFKHPRLRASFSFQDMYMGLSPFEAPATFSLLQYTELADGVWFPSGGMASIVDALLGIAETYGSEFIHDAAVTRIDINNGRASGVTLSNGTHFAADLVVANADLPYVYRDLLPPSKDTKKLLRKRYSCSTITFFWGLDRRFEQLPPHNLYLSDNFQENFDSITRDNSIPTDPSLYIHAPVRLDPSMAPQGQDTLIAIVPVGHIDGQSPARWEEIVQRARAAVCDRLKDMGLPNVEKHITFEMTAIPHDWRDRFNLVKGATHGLSHTLNQMAYFRPHNRHKRYHNLYFAGASTHPGTGIPCALLSGKFAAERIVKEIPLARTQAVLDQPVPLTVPKEPAHI